MVWDEFHKYAGVNVEIRLPGGHHRKRFDRIPLPVDHEEETILVKN